MTLQHSIYAHLVAAAHARAMQVADEATARHEYNVHFQMPLDQAPIAEPSEDPSGLEATGMPTGMFHVLDDKGKPVARAPVDLGATKTAMHRAIENALATKVRDMRALNDKLRSAIES
jgi:hypothetical protein